MVIAGPLLETKLYAPRPHRRLAPRPRLTARLDQGVESKLTLVSAPAGFGKTTLLADWLSASGAKERAVAWLSLDESDNQPARFWTYLIAALQMVAPGVGASALALLQSPRPPPLEAIIATLLNELTAILKDVVLVLDDYHLTDAREVQEGMAFLLEHLPPCMHLVIASRADPALPLARLRARGELVELRAAELRFLREEAAAFLNDVMGLGLTAQEVAALEGRTEGWIAALQLAALSLPGRENVAGFIAGFAGDDRYIVDYLVEEVLQRQPDAVRLFLLRTSILDRLSGPLCEATTGQDGARAMLDALERGNLFVVPLDDRRRWYRYHHLFADVLQAHLLDEQPDQVPELHRRASAWYEQDGHPSEAIRHALAADDFARAADLAERAPPAMRRSKQGVAVAGWLKALPDALLRVRPVLSTAYAWALMACGELDAVEARLRDAERWLDVMAAAAERPDAAATAMVVVDEAEFHRLPGAIAVYRAALAQARGDGPATVRYARRVLDLVPEDEHLARGAAAALLGLAAWESGQLEAAYGAYAQGMAALERAGNIADAIDGAIALADIRREQGRLHEARRTYEEALQRATERGEPALVKTADLYVGLSELHHEWNDLPAAAQYLLRGKELAERTGIPHNRSRWCAAMARIRQAGGDLDSALDLLLEAERLYRRDFFPNVRPVAALKARVWIAQGRLGDALDWARAQRLPVEDDISYLRECEHITLARVLLARSRRDRADDAIRGAIGLLARLMQAAEAGERTSSVIEILTLQALAHQMQGDIAAALAPLRRALTLAEPEGFVRVFVDEGPPMAVLLEAAAKHRIAPNYVRQLQTAFGRAEDRAPANRVLSEPLSERELDVLRLLGTDLDGPEIARELVVSLNTMRTHTKNIYSKLGVNTRRAAVRRAEELDLVSRTRGH